MAVAVIALAAAGCGSAANRTPNNIARIIDTVPLGELPEPPTGAVQPEVPSSATTVPTTVAAEPVEAPVGEHADGSDLLLVGDTSLATLTERQEGGGCAALTPLGWNVEIEAEVARYLSFADDVIDQLVVAEGAPEWSVVGLQFGRHVDSDAAQFGQDLDAVLDRLGDRPVILYTVAVGDDGETDQRPPSTTELDADAQASLDQRVLIGQINTQIRLRARTRTNVVLADWATIVTDGLPVPAAGGEDDGSSTTVATSREAGSDFDYVDVDGVPTEDGTARLIALTVEMLGAAPGFTPTIDAPGTTEASGRTAPIGSTVAAAPSGGGECLESVFTDDSAIVL